ncbi:FMN-binding protein [Winogradskya consettensis]|uniref:FMN-binding protein n=1 Tax=Winogradskya consettensis TaxID=113560 RepID=A0A919SPC4_9ACTN|nr:FMN-binding protein [Actinoplanes consettensis]GIM75077.1 FMN-binding protein [Actinoplanes consettensis]
MRRISLWLFSTVAALVLLFSYRTSTGDAAPATPVAAAAPVVPTTAPAPEPSGTSSASGSGASKTYTGSVAQTQWGPVQVAITVVNGKITDVQVPVYPNGNHRDEEINARALPVLTQETLAAQNAAIDTVSGATVTTNGYLESLQAALDAAHLS